VRCLLTKEDSSSIVWCFLCVSYSLSCAWVTCLIKVWFFNLGHGDIFLLVVKVVANGVPLSSVYFNSRTALDCICELLGYLRSQSFYIYADYVLWLVAVFPYFPCAYQAALILQQELIRRSQREDSQIITYPSTSEKAIGFLGAVQIPVRSSAFIIDA